MRVLHEGSSLLKYWLLTEKQYLRLPAAERTGVAVVASDDYTCMLRIENLRHEHNLTPWLRRRVGIPITIPERWRSVRPRPVESSVVRPLIRQARYGALTDAVSVTIHPVGDRYVVHAAAGGHIAARVLPARAADLRLLLSRLQLRYGRLQLTVVDRSAELVAALVEFGFSHHLLLEAERMADLARGRESALRNILVVTNLNGPELPALLENLAFWSRGPGGCRFRHVYGSLTARRAERALAQRHWDLIIYRGHGQVVDGRIAWLAETPWALPAGVCRIYLHLSCLDAPQKLDLAQLPAPHLVTPLAVVADFSDADFVREFLIRHQKSGSFLSAARAVQRVYPHFAAVCGF